MSKLILFHGSQEIIEKPQFGKGKVYNDYGQGFYCTQSSDVAKEWACVDESNGYVNRYEIETDDLRILYLSGKEFSILNWLAILIENRTFRLSTSIEKKAKDYLIDNFLPAYRDYDAIVGYRADDSYFTFAKDFIRNTISLAQLSKAMKLGKLGEQFVLKSEKAFDSIVFQDYSIAEGNIFYTKRKDRDFEARDSYNRLVCEDDIDGIYMRDILKEKMMANDERLQ